MNRTQDLFPDLQTLCSPIASGSRVINKSFLTREISLDSVGSLPVALAASSPLESSSPRNQDLITSRYYKKSEIEGFDKYLIIKENALPQKAAAARKKQKIPPAVTGKALFQHLENVQKNKDLQKQKQEDRKIARELKKAEKENALKKRSLKRNKTDNIVYDDSSSDDLPDIENVCKACFGESGEPGDWIGCDTCAAWFHKDCLNVSLDDLSDSELEELDWRCIQCEKIR